jgi:hypothetical protein
MFSFHVPKVFSATAAVVIACLAGSQLFAASPNAGEQVTLTATGTFDPVPISGADTLLLAGEPFTINLVGNSSMKPINHGMNWAVYDGLTVSGDVHSGLLGTQPIPIQSKAAALEQTVGADQNILQVVFPVQILGINLTVKARLILPGGTLANPFIRPFSSTAITTTGSTVSYSDTTASTVLGIQDGTVVATVPPAAKIR